MRSERRDITESPMLRATQATLATALLAGTAPVDALAIDFEEFGHGEVVGRVVAADNFNRSFDYAVAFDTNAADTADPDLERGGGWSVGNLAPSTDLGNILILQENDTGCASGTCSSPDDEGERPAGTFAFRLGDGEVASFFSFDLIDVEVEEGAATREGGSITFFLEGFAFPGGPVPHTAASFSFADFLSLGQGVVYGDHSANHVELTLNPFNAFQIRMGGSGGIDNLFANGVPIPEPTPGALLVLGLIGLAASTRRRR